MNFYNFITNGWYLDVREIVWHKSPFYQTILLKTITPKIIIDQIDMFLKYECTYFSSSIAMNREKLLRNWVHIQ